LKALKTALRKTELGQWRTEADEKALKANPEWIEQCDPESYRRSLREDDLAAIETHGPPVVADFQSKINSASEDGGSVMMSRKTVSPLGFSPAVIIILLSKKSDSFSTNKAYIALFPDPFSPLITSISSFAILRH
jgi:hypothetical protein